MKRLIAFVFALCLAVTAQAAQFVTYESITVAAAAVGLSATTIKPTASNPGNQDGRACSFRLETAEVRYRYDGVDPTSAEGTLLEPGEFVNIGSPEDARRIKFIRTGGTSGTLKGGCWR